MASDPLNPPPPSLPLPVSILLLLLLLLAVFPTPSQGNYSCPISSTCGEYNITYPFWPASDPNDTYSYCGYTNFMLFCQDNTYPILRLSDDSYIVTDINPVSHTITLVDADVFSPSITCPRVRHNLTSLSDAALTYSPLDAKLFFFFNCTDFPQNNNTIFCLDSGRNRSYVFTEEDVPREHDFSSFCGDIVVAPVLQTNLLQLYEPMNQIYGNALQHGFKLGWSEATTGYCADCERSHGRCGFNRTGTNTSVFTCFCSDGVTQVHKCGQKKNFKRIIVIAVGVSAAIAAFLLCASILFCRYKRKLKYATSNTLIRKASSKPSYPEEYGVHFQTQLFSYNELHGATNGFDTSNELGDGGFGTVYKGTVQIGFVNGHNFHLSPVYFSLIQNQLKWLLPTGTLSDGRIVAIKRLFHNNRQIEQFMNEIEILSRLHHQNLVDLYGCTSCESKELLLVYEFVPNGTVADHIHGSRASEGILKWPLRLNIAIETADALAYLHAIDPPIIHRDVKTSNILLDRSYHVKLADFGLSRLFPTDVTHVSTAPQGTPGYLDPEYHQCYQLTNKSDVYSFGVVLMELISSKPAVDITRPRKEINLANMALNRIQTGQLDQLVDESLAYQSDQATRKMIAMVAEVAFRCLQADGDMRPSIKEVLESLQTIQSEGCTILKKGKKAAENGVGVDAGLLNTVGPFSPDTVMNQWVSNSTTPNTSV